ncbi:MAG: DUF4232 domain-containing protein [Actinomycetota bacterium]|nr:DUF4232 domain-containing protein [Actinomycetota bacterium]
MKKHTIGRISAGGVLLLAALAGCGGGGGGTTSPQSAPPSVPSTSTESSATSPTATVAPLNSSPEAASATPPVAAADDKASASDCKAAELTLSVKDGDAAAGTVYRSLVFTNKGSRTCTMQGFPGVSYVAGADGHQVGPAAFRDGTKGPAVTLNPGGTATAPVGFVNVRNYDAAVCKPTNVRGLRIYPPHDTASMFVAMEGVGCAGTPPGNQLTVKTVV